MKTSQKRLENIVILLIVFICLNLLYALWSFAEQVRVAGHLRESITTRGEITEKRRL